MPVHANENYIKYIIQSAYGTHIHNRPTRQWTGTPWVEIGTYINWNEDPVDADVMAEEYLDLYMGLFKDTVSCGLYEIWSTVPGEDFPRPVYAKNLSGVVGTSTDATQDRGWQRTYSFRTTGGWPARIVALDTPTGGLASKYTALPDPSPEFDLMTYFISPDHAFSGRADERPASFVSLVTDTNEALLRKYGVK